MLLQIQQIEGNIVAWLPQFLLKAIGENTCKEYATSNNNNEIQLQETADYEETNKNDLTKTTTLKKDYWAETPKHSKTKPKKSY